MQIDNYQEYLTKECTTLKLDNADLNILFRYAFEEQLRRNLKQDQEPLNKAQLLKLLWPTHATRVDEIMAIR